MSDKTPKIYADLLIFKLFKLGENFYIKTSAYEVHISDQELPFGCEASFIYVAIGDESIQEIIQADKICLN